MSTWTQVPEGMAVDGDLAVRGVWFAVEGAEVVVTLPGGSRVAMNGAVPLEVLAKIPAADHEAVGLLVAALEDQLPPTAATVPPETVVRTRGRISGGSFAFDIPDGIPSLWGDGSRKVLWPKGEPMMIAGPAAAPA